MKGTDLSHPGLDGGKKRAVFTGSPRTAKGYASKYFQGTKLQVIFGLRRPAGLNTTIVSICIAARRLRRRCAVKVKCVFELSGEA